jgi:DNA-binding CsgD family transcriptional regulator
VNLTPAEIKVLRLIVAGKRNQYIANEFGISVHTVRNQLHSIYEKLDVHNKTHAVVVAMKQGLI